jgi:hypothetical protein
VELATRPHHGSLLIDTAALSRTTGSIKALLGQVEESQE